MRTFTSIKKKSQKCACNLADLQEFGFSYFQTPVVDILGQLLQS